MRTITTTQKGRGWVYVDHDFEDLAPETTVLKFAKVKAGLYRLEGTTTGPNEDGQIETQPEDDYWHCYYVIRRLYSRTEWDDGVWAVMYKDSDIATFPTKRQAEDYAALRWYCSRTAAYA